MWGGRGVDPVRHATGGFLVFDFVAGNRHGKVDYGIGRGGSWGSHRLLEVARGIGEVDRSPAHFS